MHRLLPLSIALILALPLHTQPNQPNPAAANHHKPAGPMQKAGINYNSN